MKDLQKLFDDVQRFYELNASLPELRRKRDKQTQKVRTLKEASRLEQKKAAQLEAPSISGFLLGLTGKREKRLETQRREAWEAKAAYDLAARELHALETQARNTEAERVELLGCEARFEAALAEAGRQRPDAAELLSDLERRQARLAELAQAVAAVNDARNGCVGMLVSLEEAESLGGVDMLGGGLATSLMKHQHLDEAAAKAETLSKSVERVRRELKDVELTADVGISISSFDRFTDLWLDSLFFDMNVQEKIRDSVIQVRELRLRLEGIGSRLNACAEAEKAARLETRLALYRHLIRD